MEQGLRYSALLQHLQAGIVVHAPDTSILMSNAKAGELLGLTEDEMHGKTAIDPAWNFINEEYSVLKIDEYPVNRVLRTLEPIENQILGICIPNRADITWLSVNGLPLFNSDGSLKEIIMSFIDITSPKLAEAKLIESETRFRNVANSSMALIWTSGVDKLCDYFNETWLKYTGRTFEQEYGNGWAEGVHPDDFDRCLDTYVTSFDKQIPFQMEYRLKHVSGEYRWLIDMGTPNYNSNGEFVGYIGHCFDINERKNIEEKLRESEKQLLKKTADLEYLNNFFVNRELRMVELKKEVNELLKQLGLEKKYDN